MIDLNEVADLLNKAREELLERGWVQGVMFSSGKVCAVGAIAAATGCYDERGFIKSSVPYEEGMRVSQLFAVAVNYLGEAAGANSVPGWNDRPGRRESEVIAAFERAALKAKEKGCSTASDNSLD